MKNDYTEIAFVLDRSGSMESCADAAIEGFNRFLRDQQETQGLAKLTLVLFDDEYLVPVRSIPVHEFVPLDRETYVPRSMTALLDAVGQTVDELGQAWPSSRKATALAKVVVAILTDGLENASTRFSWSDVATQIKHQTDEYKWTFLFLGANQDAIATGAQMNIAANNAATYVADAAGAKSSQNAVGRKLRSLRLMRMECASAEHEQDAAAPMSFLVAEEDQKERGSDT